MTTEKGTEMAKRNTARVLEPTNEVETVTTTSTNDIPLDDKGRKKVVAMSMEDVDKKGWKNKSQIIRGLAGENFSPSAIAKFLDIRYQHVRNVLNQPLKRPSNQDPAVPAGANEEVAEADQS